MKRSVSIIFVLFSTGYFCYAQQKNIVLYPDGVPNSKKAPVTYTEKIDKDWITQVTEPTITPYFPVKEKANGAAVLICPGGGYAGLASGHEGGAIASAFNEIGITAFVLKYRLPSDDIMVDKTIGPLQDAQMGMLLIRKRAAEWHINPAKIGVIGFSAGGHLASTLGTHFEKAVIANRDNISLRPDFMLLIYPVITFGEFTHTGSRENLIGKTPSADQVKLYSNELQVTGNTPPTFLLHAQDDGAAPVENSLKFYEALVKAKIKAEIHIFQDGGHGFGLNNPKSSEKWFNWATAWLDANGFLNGK